MTLTGPGALETSSPADAGPRLPAPRGPLTGYLVDALQRPPHELAPPPVELPGDGLGDEDLQLALYLCYELHYRSFAGVHDAWEWEPSLLAWRRRLEGAFERALRVLVPPLAPPADGDVEQALRALVDSATGPSLSAFVERCGTPEQVREFAVHRSAYQLKEADPHTWGIPRLCGEAKAALVEIQADEYGGGAEAAMHCTLFAGTLRSLGLDDRYGAYLDLLPASTLATVNLVSLFGLHRRWRAALVGHLTAFEMTSVVPMGRYARALDRLGVGPEGRRFYDAHVEADALHQHIAVRGLAGGLARQHPSLGGDVLFGAAALLAVEERFARHLLAAWSSGTTSLRRPLATHLP